MQAALTDAGPSTTRWQSWDARLGRPGPWHVRTDNPDGPKRVQWRQDDGSWTLGDHQLGDLIYGGELVARGRPDSLYVLTEGEKAADAVRGAGYLGIGTVCGANATPSGAVLRMFRDRHVTIWPDADLVGAEHMARIAKRLEQLGVASLYLVNWREAEDHADAADADPELIGRLIANARRMPLLRPLCARCSADMAA